MTHVYAVSKSRWNKKIMAIIMVIIMIITIVIVIIVVMILIIRETSLVLIPTLTIIINKKSQHNNGEYKQKTVKRVSILGDSMINLMKS